MDLLLEDKIRINRIPLNLYRQNIRMFYFCTYKNGRYSFFARLFALFTFPKSSINTTQQSKSSAIPNTHIRIVNNFHKNTVCFQCCERVSSVFIQFNSIHFGSLFIGRAHEKHSWISKFKIDALLCFALLWIEFSMFFSFLIVWSWNLISSLWSWESGRERKREIWVLLTDYEYVFVCANCCLIIEVTMTYFPFRVH